MRIVFTGPAQDEFGLPIVRADLTTAAESAGFIVMPKVDSSVDCLIASRTDTVKAKKAKQLGVAVKDYAEFVKELHAKGIVIENTDRTNLYVDSAVVRESFGYQIVPARRKSFRKGKANGGV